MSSIEFENEIICSSKANQLMDILSIIGIVFTVIVFFIMIIAFINTNSLKKENRDSLIISSISFMFIATCLGIAEIVVTNVLFIDDIKEEVKLGLSISASVFLLIGTILFIIFISKKSNISKITNERTTTTTTTINGKPINSLGNKLTCLLFSSLGILSYASSAVVYTQFRN